MSDWCPENDGAYRAELAAIHQSSQDRRIVELEARLGRAVQTINACRDTFRRLGFLDASIAIESIDAALAEIGVPHD